MDLKKKAASEASGGEGWTEERHASYLNKIEEHFVRTMLAGGGGGGGGGGGAIMTTPPSLRLDRYLPDSATESNRDRVITTATDSGTQNLAARNHNTKKKRKLPHLDPSLDQVVPEKANSPKNKKRGKQVSRWL